MSNTEGSAEIDPLWQNVVQGMDGLIYQAVDEGIEVIKNPLQDGYHQRITDLNARLTGLSLMRDVILEHSQVLTERTEAEKPLLAYELPQENGEIAFLRIFKDYVEMGTTEHHMKYERRSFSEVSKEYQIAQIFLGSIGRAFTGSEILEMVWGDSDVTESTKINYFYQTLSGFNDLLKGTGVLYKGHIPSLTDKRYGVGVDPDNYKQPENTGIKLDEKPDEPISTHEVILSSGVKLTVSIFEEHTEIAAPDVRKIIKNSKIKHYDDAVRLLEFLLEHQGVPFTGREIITEIWSNPENPDHDYSNEFHRLVNFWQRQTMNIGLLTKIKINGAGHNHYGIGIDYTIVLEHMRAKREARNTSPRPSTTKVLPEGDDEPPVDKAAVFGELMKAQVKELDQRELEIITYWMSKGELALDGDDLAQNALKVSVSVAIIREILEGLNLKLQKQGLGIEFKIPSFRTSDNDQPFELFLPSGPTMTDDRS